MPTPPTPTRILYLSNGGHIDGSQRQLGYVIKNLPPDQFKPIVATYQDGPFTRDLINAGVETHVMKLRPWRKWPICLLRHIDAPRLTRFAREKQINLVHASDLWLNGYLLNITQNLYIPSITHIRAPITPEYIQKYKLDKTTALIPIAERIKTSLLNADLPPSQIHLIDDSVDLNHFTPNPPNPDSFLNDHPNLSRPLIGLVGRLEPFKRQHEFINAAIPFLQQNPDPTILLIGDPIPGVEAYTQQLKQRIAEHNLSNRIIFTGRRNDIPATLTSLDLLVTLSGGSIMFEAMACKTPVLSVRRSNSERSKHITHLKTGYHVISADPAKLTSALQSLIQDTALLQTLASNGHDYIRQNLAQPIMVQKTIDLYNLLLKNHNPQHAP